MRSYKMVLALLVVMSGAVFGEERVPYPAALDAAAMTVDSLDSIDSNACFMGNGDLNALVFENGGAFELVVSKNDVWDSRVNTSADGQLPNINIKEHSWSGAWKAQPSWKKNRFPNQAACSRVRIEGGGVVEAVNVPATAKVGVKTAAGSVELRTLWQANVFLIKAEGKITLEGYEEKSLPKPRKGTAGRMQWLEQILPGDEDYAGMKVLTAAERKGDWCAVAVVSSLDAPDMLAQAQKLVADVLADPAAAIAEHEAGWKGFWSKSGVELAQPDFQNWWYRQLYYFRCFTRPGAVAAGLQAGYARRARWHGSYKINYNIWQTYWTPFAYNHPELAEPWVDHLFTLLPRGRWFANAGYGCEGAAFHSDTWPHEVHPDQCNTKNRHQSAYIPWGYTMGMSGMAIQNLWNHYLFTQDKEYLGRRSYPVVREVATFFASFIEQCRIDESGKAVLGPSYNPEHGPFGTDDNPYDLAYSRYTLDAAIEAAGILGKDAELVKRWKKCRDLLAPYPLYKDPEQGNGTIVGNWHGGEYDDTGKDYNIAVPVVPLFPAEQFSWFSPEEDKALFERSINHVEPRYTRGNSVVIMNAARARLSLTADAMADTQAWFKKKEQPNGLFHWERHGYYMSEQAAVGALINEFLLQGVGGIVRVFPAWPKDADAAFTDLRAQGGFLVSAQQKDAKLIRLRVESTAGGTLRLLSPWKGIRVKNGGAAKPLKADERGVVEIETKAGDVLEFSLAQTAQGRQCPVSDLAEDGYDLWLRYPETENVELRTQYQKAVRSIAVTGKGETPTVIRAEPFLE